MNSTPLLLQELLEEFHEKMAQFHGGIHREQDFPSIPNKIKVAIGMRRTGKTFLLFQKIKALMEKKVPITRILYLNFEDDRLLPLTQQKLRELIDGFYSLFPENHDQLCYLFLDEIQNVEEWPLVIRRYFDSKKVEIFLTGSSAKLLSKEIATSLRGRSITLEVWPFDFKEYLLSQDKLPTNKLMGKKIHDNLRSDLIAYLTEGGFPESIGLDMPNRILLLQNYVNVVIFRDIIERYKITNISLIKYMIKSLLKNTGSAFSANKFFKDLKSQGFSVGKMTIHEYLNYIEDGYLAFTVPLYSESLRKTQTNPRKTYAIDTGLVNSYITHTTKNHGHFFENIVYLDLRRKNHEVYYYLTEDRYEVDFLTKDPHGKLHLYQVAWDLDNRDTLERETRALKQAEKELDAKGMIITPDNYFEWLSS